MRRIFLAIPAPPEVHTYLEKLQEANQNNLAIKWTKDFNLHLTIYFIGNINPQYFDNIVTTVLPAIKFQKAFTLDFEKVCFAPSKKSKMIWARFHKHNSFTQLSNAIYEALKPIMLKNKLYYKEPVPHITLARFNSVKQLDNLIIPDSPGFASIHITPCQLWESIATPEGIRYERVASFNLYS